MLRIPRHLLLWLVCLSTAAAAQTQERRPIGQEQKRQAVVELAKLMRQRYAIAEAAEKGARAIEEKLARGGYDSVNDAKEFGELVEADLRAVTKDQHLRFGVPDPQRHVPATTTDDPAAQRAAWLADMRRGNYGLMKAEILPGNVGYLRVRRFEPPELTGDTLVGVMGFLANVDAIIVDVRSCHGGSAHTMPFFCAYFLDKPTSLYDMEFRGDDFTERFWTQAYVPGKRIANVPMYILTSGYTFSGAEGFAYRFQVLKRAKVVGEVTMGGANAGGILDVPPFFTVWMPMGRPVDRDTGTNWEGTGVKPDIDAAARDALAVAHIDALRALDARAPDERERERLRWAIQRAKAGLHPIAVAASELERFAGMYGRVRVWVEGGQLRFQPEVNRPYLLTPVTPLVFATEAEDRVRGEFQPGADGRIKKLLYTDEDGNTETFARSD